MRRSTSPSSKTVVGFFPFILMGFCLFGPASAADFTVSANGANYQAVNNATGTVYTHAKAYDVINWAIREAGNNGGGVVHLKAGEYEIADYDTIIGDTTQASSERWQSARPDVSIEHGVTTKDDGSSALPDYQPQGSSVTKITIAKPASGPHPTGLIAYVNFDEVKQLDQAIALAYWLRPNKRIMLGSRQAAFNFVFSKTINAEDPFHRIAIYHTENGNAAEHKEWRGHRMPSHVENRTFLNTNTVQLADVKSIGIELTNPGNIVPNYVVNNEDAEDTELYIDDLTAHYGQIHMEYDNVILQGEGPYHTILKTKDYGNLPTIYLAAKDAEVRYLQVHGNADNCTLIDYCEGIDAADYGDMAGTSIHHTMIQQTQGSSITMRRSNTRIYENLLVHSENPMVDMGNNSNNEVARNTLKYGTNDAFIYLKYPPPTGVGHVVSNNEFFPVVDEAAFINSNSPDHPQSYATRFNNAIKVGIHAYEDTYGHVIQENKFYNMKDHNPDMAAVRLSKGAHDIRVEENRFYNSYLDLIRNSTLFPYNIQLINNYIENGRLNIAGGSNNVVTGNVIKAGSSMIIAGNDHSISDNYVSPDSNYTETSEGETVDEEPVLKEVSAGISWEWGALNNGGFENGSNATPDGWQAIGASAYSSHIWTSDVVYAVHGAKAAQVEVTGLDAVSAFEHAAGWSTQSYIRVFPGEVLTAAALVKLENYSVAGAGASREGLSFDIDFYQEDGSPCAVPSKNIWLVQANSPWTRLQREVDIPAGCTKAMASVLLYAANGKATVDEVKFYRKRDLTEIGPSVSLDNASFELSDQPLNSGVPTEFNNWDEYVAPPDSFLSAVDDRVHGAAAMKLHKSQDSAAAWVKQQVYTLSPDTHYYLEYSAKRDPGLPTHESRVQLVDVFTTKVYLQDDLTTWSSASNYIDALLVKETSWTRRAINFKTPPSSLFSGNMEIRFFNAGASDMYLDDVRLYQGIGDTAPVATVHTPAGLVATPVSGSQVDLDWADSQDPGLAHYNVYRAEDPAGPFVQIATGLVSSQYSDTGVAESTTYYYAIGAVSGTGDISTFSRRASATTPTVLACMGLGLPLGSCSNSH